ncbi:hypothetical protein, partial [Desulfonatronospira sp.]
LGPALTFLSLPNFQSKICQKVSAGFERRSHAFGVINQNRKTPNLIQGKLQEISWLSNPCIGFDLRFLGVSFYVLFAEFPDHWNLYH